MTYMNSITKLFEEEKDCIELIKIKEIMHEPEKTTDAAEHVGKYSEKPDCKVRIKVSRNTWNY